MHKRTAIRHYAVELLKHKVDLGGRVFANRPAPRFLENLPCICVYFEAEPTTTKVGSGNIPKQQERTLTLNVDILTEDPIDSESEIEMSQKGEDFLDEIALQVEMALYDDKFFAKELDGYDPQDIDSGLIDGVILTNTIPYGMDSGGDRRIIAQRLQWNAIYETDCFRSGKKLPYLNTLNFKINKIGFNSNTVDPTLSEGQIDYGA